MTLAIHINRAPAQPATAWLDIHGPGEPILRTMSPRRILSCWTCGRRRWAKYLVVQSYYDETQVHCAEGHTWRKVFGRDVAKTRKSDGGGG